jgi:hypothetical protein
MIFEQIRMRSPPPAPLASKKRRLNYGVVVEEEGSFMMMMSPPLLASPDDVGMYNGLFIPDLDEKPHNDLSGRTISLRPRLEDSRTTHHFHLSHRDSSSKRQDYNSNSSLPWCPDVPMLEEEDEVKNNNYSKRSRPSVTSIRPTRNLLPRT